jgi:hypothetical protein
LALQVVGDCVAGNVGRGRVVLNLQVATDLVVVDRQRGVIVAGLEIVADRMARQRKTRSNSSLKPASSWLPILQALQIA